MVLCNVYETMVFSVWLRLCSLWPPFIIKVMTAIHNMKPMALDENVYTLLNNWFKCKKKQRVVFNAILNFTLNPCNLVPQKSNLGHSFFFFFLHYREIVVPKKTDIVSLLFSLKKKKKHS